MPTPIITVKNLVKKYGNFTAVNGISFEVNPGEIFGLLGPNGAGKSTTLEIIETLREKRAEKYGSMDSALTLPRGHQKNYWCTTANCRILS